jgi:hypothetical protein
MGFEDEPSEMDEETPEDDEPDFRAVVRRSGAVRLVQWGPWLQSTGPAYALVAARDRAGVAIADLRGAPRRRGNGQRIDRRVSQRRRRHAPRGADRLGALRRLHAGVV